MHRKSPVRLAVPLLALVAATCIPTRIPQVAPAPAPFGRYPYLQAVSDSAAHVLWSTTSPGLRDTLVYWIEGRDDTTRVPVADSAREHRARLAPLPPDARVGYRVITGPPRQATPDHRFRTAPRPGARGEVGVLVFGDSGTGADAQVDLARLMEERDFDLVLHTGDVAYPEGSEFDLTQRHFRVYRELLARVPFFPAVGNHDVRTEEGAPFRRAFLLPGRRPVRGALYYSFDWGRVHFVGLDSTDEGDDAEEDDGGDLDDYDRDGGDRRLGRRQLQWLEADLAEASADPGTDWIVAFFHHPPYSSGYGISSHSSDEELRRLLAPLFERYGVDLVLTGHDHHYERTHPIRSGEVDEETPGTVYVVTGGGGGRLELRGLDRTWYAAVSRLTYHFVTLRVKGDEMLLEAVDREGERIDRYRVRPVPAAADDPAGSPSSSASGASLSPRTTPVR